MTIARAEIITEGVEGIYHCTSRCVRQAFLCGYDKYTGRSYEHRRAWIRDHIKRLAKIFALEVCAYAVMSNHTHVVLRTRPDLVGTWPDREVARRWLSLFPTARKELDSQVTPDETKIRLLADSPERLQEIRRRLASVSWFMRCLNEYIARRANREDHCKGRFWEGRFKSQALLDESAVLACMAYVDLNPVRAGLALTPETSEFASVFDRIAGRQMRHCQAPSASTKTAAAANRISAETQPDQWLVPFATYVSSEKPQGFLPITEDEYLRLIDCSGRLMIEGKKGSIPDHLNPILDRLSVDAGYWLTTVQSFGGLFQRVVGRHKSIKAAAHQAGQKWLKGLQAARTAFS